MILTGGSLIYISINLKKIALPGHRYGNLIFYITSIILINQTLTKPVDLIPKKMRKFAVQIFINTKKWVK